MIHAGCYHYVFFLGKPASGKGTQIRLLLEAYEGHTFSTGDALKDHIARGTDLGKKVKEIINAGKLVPDDIVMDLFRDTAERLDPPLGNALFLVDGFPRTEGQYRLLKQYIGEKRIPSTFLYFAVEDDLILRRLAGRLVCNKCFAPFTAGREGVIEGSLCPQCKEGALARRSDDNEATIRNRLAEYQAMTAPMVSLIAVEEKERFREIDGSRAAGVIFEELIRCAPFVTMDRKKRS